MKLQSIKQDVCSEMSVVLKLYIAAEHEPGEECVKRDLGCSRFSEITHFSNECIKIVEFSITGTHSLMLMNACIFLIVLPRWYRIHII